MIKPKRQPRSEFFQPGKLVAVGEEMIRNGGNTTKAIRIIFPETEISGHALHTLAQRIRRTEIVKRMMAEAEAAAARSLALAVERFAASQDRTAEELARVAFSQFRDVATIETVTDPKTKQRRQVVTVRDSALISDDAHRAIAKVTQHADGRITVDMHDKLTALRDLARLKGWIADKPADNTAAVSLIIQR